MGDQMRRSQAVKPDDPRLQPAKTAHHRQNASQKISSRLSLSELPPLPSSATNEASSDSRDRLAARAHSADIENDRSAPFAGELLEEGPWNSQSAFRHPRKPSKNSEAVAGHVGRFELRSLTQSNHPVPQATSGSEEPQYRRHENKSSAQHTGKGTAQPSKAGRPSYADVTKGSGLKGVRYGQLSFKVGPTDDNFFACMLCKRKFLWARVSNTSPYTSPTCAHVYDERSARRGTAWRHVRPDDAQGENHIITEHVHMILKGEAHQLAKELARRLGLQGRQAEIFQWREGFVFLHPTYEPIKHLINPHGYDDLELDMASLRAAENGQPSQGVSSITTSAGVAAFVQPHPNLVTPSDPTSAPSNRTQQPARRAVADRQKHQTKRVRQQSPSSPTWAQVARGTAVIPTSPSLRVDPSAQRTPRYLGPAHQSPTRCHRCPPATNKPLGQDPSGIRHEQNDPWSQPHNEIHHELHPLPNSEYPQLPNTGVEFSLSGPGDHYPLPEIPNDPLSDTGSHGAASFDYSSHHGAQSPDWALTRIPGHPSQILSLPRTESTPLSSLPESIPGFTHGTGSTQTGHKSYYGPPTPGEPVTPTPQPPQDFLGLFIDPRLLEKQPLHSVPENIDTDVLSEIEILPAVPKHGSRRSGGRKRK